MSPVFDTVEEGLRRFTMGDPIVVVDDEDRENEGDIVFPACHSTPEKINFCITEARGLVCIAIDEAIADRLQLKKVRTNHKDPFHTAFLDSIDASKDHGITTGISAFERSITAQLVSSEMTTASDFITPGHLFPLLAKKGGVLVRRGHTESAVDLCELSGLPKAAIICEILHPDGSMMRRDSLAGFAAAHKLAMITISDLVAYRSKAIANCQMVSRTILPTQHGEFVAKVYQNTVTGAEHLLLIKEKDGDEMQPLVRIHSECLTGDVLGSLRCDCGEQLQKSLAMIQQHGHGYLVYLRGHEGRGIGLGKKIAAYHLQDQGCNTFEANLKLGLPADARKYDDVISILRNEQLDYFELLSNNPSKAQALSEAGFHFKVHHFSSTLNEYNENYLKDKIAIAHHKLILNP